MFAALDIGDIVNGNLWIILGSVRHFSELHAVKFLCKCEYTLAHIVKREVRAYLVLVKIVFLGPYLLGIVVVVPWLDGDILALSLGVLGHLGYLLVGALHSRSPYLHEKFVGGLRCLCHHIVGHIGCEILESEYVGLAGTEFDYFTDDGAVVVGCG